jgi:hypothetical protein
MLVRFVSERSTIIESYVGPFFHADGAKTGKILSFMPQKLPSFSIWCQRKLLQTLECFTCFRDDLHGHTTARCNGWDGLQDNC